METDAWIYVDVAGAVRTPGVVKLARGARVYEAIELAGGFAKDAAISAVNQASVLQDGQATVYRYSRRTEDKSDCHLPRVLWKRPVRAEWQMQAKSISIRHQKKN